ncbi:unnamed protein product [Phytomonas sp. EM1]|nr:unnamed protein product [Phytomonas sp. EM1]|eukprot:CCW60923.1 unnamed protein product [Phytomonas sp. isolate EM1]
MPQPYNKSNGKKTATKNYSTPCKYFQRGRCTNPRCPYLHVRASTDAATPGLNPKVETTISSNVGVDIMKTMLRLFFEKQQNAIYNVEQGLLNLSHLGQHEDLRSVSSSINFNTKAFCKALCHCVHEICLPPPSALSLEGNSITTLSHLAAAMRDVGLDAALRVLSLAQNELETTEALRALRPFTHLVELRLAGNPIEERPEYRQGIIAEMPSLLVLDGTSTADPPLSLPWPQLDGSAFPTAEEERGGERSGDIVSPLEASYALVSSSSLGVVEKSVLRFLHMNVFGPLEYDAFSSGRSRGNSSVNELADVYALQAALSLSLSCPEAAVATPLKTSSGQNPSTDRTVIREIVGFRMRQTECDHNLTRGIRSPRVAVGRVRVCTQLEHWLYPPSFAVKHYVHSSMNVVNLGLGESYEGVVVATVHGVMAWCHRTTGPRGKNNSETNSDALVILRNFTRSFIIAPRSQLSADDIARGNVPAEGGWVILNDMITLLPFAAGENNGTHELPSRTTAVLFGEKVYAYGVLFSPTTDPRRIHRHSCRYDVPVSVVGVLCAFVHNDLELVEILTDLSGVPLNVFQQLAALVEQDPIAAVFLCRLERRYSVQPDAGVEILKRCEMNWEVIRSSMESSTPTLASVNGPTWVV